MDDKLLVRARLGPHEYWRWPRFGRGRARGRISREDRPRHTRRSGLGRFIAECDQHPTEPIALFVLADRFQVAETRKDTGKMAELALFRVVVGMTSHMTSGSRKRLHQVPLGFWPHAESVPHLILGLSTSNLSEPAVMAPSWPPEVTSAIGYATHLRAPRAGSMGRSLGRHQSDAMYQTARSPLWMSDRCSLYPATCIRISR
jgi:hypothetical protein